MRPKNCQKRCRVLLILFIRSGFWSVISWYWTCAETHSTVTFSRSSRVIECGGMWGCACVCRLQLNKTFGRNGLLLFWILHVKAKAFCSFHASQLSECERGPPEWKGWRISLGGVLEEEGWLVTDLLGFEDPLCGLLQGKTAPVTRRRGALGNMLVHWAPVTRNMGRAPAYPFISHRPDVFCHGALGL